ncbi:MAG: trypsin-like serine protease [Oscillospiraceae bacterium]
MNNLLKTLIAGVSALTMCISAMPLSANAATQYQKGDVNGDGIVNSSDVLALNNFLHGSVASKDSAMTERLDVNSDYIIDINDVALLKNINLGTANGGTISYKNTTNLPTQETRTYYKYNASTGAYKGQYTLNPVSSISTTSASTCSIIDEDERWAEDGLQGVVSIKYESGANNGTAFVVDSHTLVTAGHCVYNATSGKGANSKATSNLKFKVYNGSNENTSVSITPIEYQMCKTYVDGSDTQKKNYDYAIITVKEDLSDYINFNLGVVRNELYTNDSYSKKLLFVTGFGCGTTMVGVNPELIGIKSTGDGFLVSTPSSYRLYYDVDTINGDSGGPIYANVKGKQTVIGIHTNGISKDGEYNKGIRLTTDILNLIYHHK